MSEIINVKCKVCKAVFHIKDDEIDILKCLKCQGGLEPADAAPLREKENLEDTVKEYVFNIDKTSPEEARRIKEQLLPPTRTPEIPSSPSKEIK